MFSKRSKSQENTSVSMISQCKVYVMDHWKDTNEHVLWVAQCGSKAESILEHMPGDRL